MNKFVQSHSNERIIAPSKINSSLPVSAFTNNNSAMGTDNKLDLAKSSRQSTPSIFDKKRKNIDISFIGNTRGTKTELGRQRHFSPAAQEWRNSVYAYNPNYTKLFPTADKTLMDLAICYLNSKLNVKKKRYTDKEKKSLARRRKREQRKGKFWSATVRKRAVGQALTLNKVFIAYGTLKHTSSSVLITLFIYNVERLILIRKFFYEHHDLFTTTVNLTYYTRVGKNKKEIKEYNRPFTFKEQKKNPKYLKALKKGAVAMTNARLTITTKLISDLVLLLGAATPVLSNNEKVSILHKSIYKYKNLWPKTYFDKFNHHDSIRVCDQENTLHVLEKYKSLIRSITTNQLKFKPIYLRKLAKMISHTYKKKVDISFIMLKQMHLNSSIYTQAVSLKLRNRDNKLYRVLKRSLLKVKLPNINRITLNYRKGEMRLAWNNKLNINIRTFSKYANITNQDFLNKVLSKMHIKTVDRIVHWWPQNAITRKTSIVPIPVVGHLYTLGNWIIRNLRHKKMCGIRVEAKGRLTRRFTASRSVFKMRYKGGLKNIDSSFRGISAVILRGHVKTNVDYTMLQARNRNGAFGVKGWVSSK